MKKKNSTDKAKTILRALAMLSHDMEFVGRGGGLREKDTEHNRAIAAAIRAVADLDIELQTLRAWKGVTASLLSALRGLMEAGGFSVEGPDLVEVDYNVELNEALDAARDAIAKAEGRA